MDGRDSMPLPDSTTSEDLIVDVDGFSSSDNELSSRDGDEIDVGGDESVLSGFDSGSDDGNDYGEAEGGGGKKKSDHHNELEKRRRRTLNASYADLKKMVKRLHPSLKGGAGRDRIVEVATRILKTKLESWKKGSREAKELLAIIQGMRPGKDEEERKEIEQHISELTKASEMKIDLRRSEENLAASHVVDDDEDGEGDDEWEDNEEEHNSEEENCPIDDDDDDDESAGITSPESSLNGEDEENL